MTQIDQVTQPEPATGAEPGGAATPLLRVTDLQVAYGDARALFGVSFDVPSGSVTTVLGANGAGKSSLAAAIGGVVPPSAGTIEFDGRDVTGLSAHRMSRMGMSFVPESRNIFPHLTVRDNLRGADSVHGSSRRPQCVRSNARWICSRFFASARVRRPAPCRVASSRC